jgi:hypothetical protein
MTTMIVTLYRYAYGPHKNVRYAHGKYSQANERTATAVKITLRMLINFNCKLNVFYLRLSRSHAVCRFDVQGNNFSKIDNTR